MAKKVDSSVCLYTKAPLMLSVCPCYRAIIYRQSCFAQSGSPSPPLSSRSKPGWTRQIKNMRPKGSAALFIISSILLYCWCEEGELFIVHLAPHSHGDKKMSALADQPKFRPRNSKMAQLTLESRKSLCQNLAEQIWRERANKGPAFFTWINYCFLQK